MVRNKGNKKGANFEELLRAYFLRAGFFVVRGVPFIYENEDLTDIDLWLYERPTGTSRRQQIVDAKFKSKPKAVERIFWTKGVIHGLGADGGYVATTDKRYLLRPLARKMGINLIDGHDISRIGKSSKVQFADRLSEEEFVLILQRTDKSRKNKDFQDALVDLKSGITEGFGANFAVRSLGAVATFAQMAIAAHPNSEAAQTSCRMVYLSAAFTSIAIDYVIAEVPFRGHDERIQAISNVIRYGASDQNESQKPLRLALAIVREFAENGAGLAQKAESLIDAKYKSIPAEMVAEQTVKTESSYKLFNMGVFLEQMCYSKKIQGFDSFDVEVKSFLGTLLDYAGVSREDFANSWISADTNSAVAGENINVDASEVGNKPIGTLFD